MLMLLWHICITIQKLVFFFVTEKDSLSPTFLHGDWPSKAVTYLSTGLNWRGKRQRIYIAPFPGCLHSSMMLLVFIPQPYSPGLAHTPKQENRKRDLKPSDAFCVWLVTVKATFEHVDDNTFLRIIVTTVSQWIPDMDQKQISDDCWLLVLSIIIFFLLLSPSDFSGFSFSLGLMVQSPAEQSHCQDQNNLWELHKGLILPIQFCHRLPETLKETRADHCCSFQIPKKVKTCHLSKIE